MCYNNVIDIGSLSPYKVSEVICLQCMYRWISARPVGTMLKSLECPCGAVGYVIETGEDLDDAQKE